MALILLHLKQNLPHLEQFHNSFMQLINIECYKKVVLFLILILPRYRSILQLIKPWYDEVKDYAFPYPQDCNPRCPMRCYGPMCTHYTQVIQAQFFSTYVMLPFKAVLLLTGVLTFKWDFNKRLCIIYADGLGHFQSNRLCNPHMP